MRVTRLKKQPPARRQVADAHAEMFNEVVSMDVNFWNWKECDSSVKKTLAVVNIVDAALVKHIASRIPNQTSHTLWGRLSRMADFVVLMRRYASEWDLHRAQISRTLFDQVKGCASFVDSDLAEAQCHMGQLDTHARFPPHDGKPKDGIHGE